MRKFQGLAQEALDSGTWGVIHGVGKAVEVADGDLHVADCCGSDAEQQRIDDFVQREGSSLQDVC